MTAELRAKLANRAATLQQTQAAVRDGDARSAASRAQGDHEMARHFERRADADRSRSYALLGEISNLERELQGLQLQPTPTNTAPSAAHLDDDSIARLRRDAKKAFEEELAVLRKRYEDLLKPR